MNLKLFGLRFNRRLEWLSLVKSEGRRVGWGSVLVSVVKAARIATVGRSVWRQRVRENKAAVGRLLLEVPGYTYRVFVTNRSDAGAVIWRDYNGTQKRPVGGRILCARVFRHRGGLSQRVVRLQPAQALPTTAAPERAYRQPATLRSPVFVAGAILGLVGKQTAPKLFQAWGGLAKHRPLLDAV